jgi:signal peptidase
MVLVIVLAFLLAGVRLFGLEPYAVISGSMEPEYHVGSLIYIKKAQVAELQVNVPITYTLQSGIVVTHRIIEVLVDEDNPTSVKYRTKGDANNGADGELVPFESVIGMPVFTIPLLGYISFALHTPIGVALIVAVICLLLILMFLPELIRNLLASDKSDTSKEDSEEISQLIEKLKEDGSSEQDDSKN